MYLKIKKKKEEKKTVVLCLKLLACILFQRIFGYILCDYLQKYNNLKRDTLWSMENMEN